MKVSVIIPVYNTTTYLEKAVRSILEQTLTELEVIAINDGSTDNSFEVLRQLQQFDERLQLYSQSNQGLSVTRNVGLSKATGEYLYFFDSDDYLCPDALENCYRKAKENTCDFVFFDAVIMNDTDPNHSAASPYQRKGILEDRCYTGAEALQALQSKKKFSTSVCLHLIRTDYLRTCKLQFYPGILHEDHLFTALLYIQATAVCYLPEDYFHRRMRPLSIMTTPVSMRNIDGCLTVCKELTRYTQLHSTPSTHRKLISQQISILINITASSSIRLPFASRMGVLRKILSGFTKHLSLASVLLLLFPCLKIKQRS